MTGRSGMKLGVNGFGRIGKLTVWHHVARQYFKEIIVNLGRDVGTCFEDIVHYIERDSSYGFLNNYLHGFNAKTAVSEIDTQNKTMTINDIKVKFLQSDRNPADIAWKENNVRIVVDTTGQFLDPTLAEDHVKGSVRGHLKAGADKVIVSAPFKIKDKGQSMPKDAVTTVMGINDNVYDARCHRIISNASCTTTCLAHMMKPLLNMFGPKKILSASMSTIHAATGSQQVLDRLPKSGAGDLRKNRSIMNNIILTSTGAAKALRLVIPEMEEIGFIAESVRIPISTGSLVILVLNFQDELSGGSIRRETINDIYQQAAADDPNNYLHFTLKQNVSGDIIGTPRAAAVIEGHETHTRTAEVTMDMGNIPGLPKDITALLKDRIVRVPITQAVIYGWYDNEMGSYVNMLGDRTVSIAENL